ncbi:MAG: sensor histidine kinase [Lachnospiraceae bacterium]|nr:sensor histidine kinase [Lachnospiraceae bacterium]
MRKKLKRIYDNSTFATKIRYSYLLLLVPLVLILCFCFYHLWDINHNYESMLNSTVVAGEFSLDFKKDFDYETYLVIVENKTPEESNLDSMLREANRIVEGLERLTTSEENKNRLKSVKRYLDNLEIYKQRIEDNLAEGNRYEDNLRIWENDVQIVTALIQESVSQYSHYEVKELQKSHEEQQLFFEEMVKYLLIAFGTIFLLLLFLSYFIPLSITRPILRLEKVTKQVAEGDLSVRSDVENGVEVRALSDSLNAMIDKINDLLEQVTTEQVRLRKAEFELLQAQINPHFLYNTLDTIIWLAEAGEQKKVVSMVGSLSDFFRSTLNRGKDIVTLKDELQHVRSYLEIQQVRYQDILQYEIEVPEEMYACRLPKITIQPLVENALYHGIKNKRGVGRIRITCCRTENGCKLRVVDNGIGITRERLAQVQDGILNKVLTGKDIYGLYNVNERIRLNFGEAYGISIKSEYGEGTVVSVLVPYVESEEENKPES